MTVAAGIASVALVKAFGGSTDDEVPFPSADSGDERESIASFTVGPDAAAVVEADGFEGSRPEVLKAASRKGKAASVFWNVNGLVVFSCARRGKVTCSYELMDGPPEGLPAGLRALASSAEDADADLVAIGAAMVEKFTGTSVRREQWSRNATTGYPIVQRVVGLPVTAEELTGLQLFSPSLLSVVRLATPASRRQVAQWATIQALSAADLLDDAAVQSVVVQFGHHAVPALTVEASRLVADMDMKGLNASSRLANDGAAREEKTARYWSVRRWATQALLYATLPDDTTAVLGALYCAQYATLRQSVLFEDAATRLEA